jgi:sulfur-oxidizing protein SoxX
MLAGAIMSLSAMTAMAEPVAPDAVVFEEGMVRVSLTGQPGSAEEGAKVFKDTKLGNCLACHANKAMPKELFHGNVGPALDGVASRYEEAQLRGIVTNAKKTFTDKTVMPGFYSLEVGVNVVKDRAGQTVLSAQQIEDVVAYLATLKE